MKIHFINATLENFKSHRNLSVNFGERTEITGDNAKGKTTIPESPSYVLYGLDAFGSKLDPTPITYESEETKVSLLLNVDGKDHLLGRSLKKGKVAYYVNDVPYKAKEFNEVVEKLFDKDLFLSLYNPNYFFTMHWEKQRAMLLRYVTAPANKEVLKHMPDEQSKSLSALLKKHSLDDIKKIHADSKKSLDKKYIAAESRTKAFKEQLEQSIPSVPLDSLNVELKHLIKQRDELEKVTDSAGDNNGRIRMIQHEIKFLLDKRDQYQNQKKSIKAPIAETCASCGQKLTDELKEKVSAAQEARWEVIKPELKAVIDKRKELEAELMTLEEIDVSEQREKVHQLQNKITPIEYEIKKHKDCVRLQKDVEQAETDEKDTLTSLNDSIFILESIKAFESKEAELQAEKVQALFTNLSVRLFKQNKGDGEISPDFEIELDGKPYRTLSLSEGIRAGLELRDVLSQQSNVISPVFVDNAESITSFKEPVGQLIISRVVAGQELKIEGMDA
ncbi:AAA family ATPase [Peribacillus loiseleuriae]|uniref:AAA family ATPase n=1 Tax=Peribacillus loiseleuriae TaxID=1679170 RepID=UPI003D06B384